MTDMPSIDQAVNTLQLYGCELETPADDVLILKNKVKHYSPSQNKDGEIFIGGHYFATKEALLALLLTVSQANKDIQMSKTFEFLQGLIYCLDPVVTSMMKQTYIEDHLPKLTYNAAKNGWVINDCMVGASESELVFNTDVLTKAIQDDSTYADTSKTSNLSSQRLIAACPETTVFTTTYPLTDKQADIVSTILNSVDRLDLEALMGRLLPSYLEAKRVSYERASALLDIEQTNLIELVDEDESRLEDIARHLNE